MATFRTYTSTAPSERELVRDGVDLPQEATPELDPGFLARVDQLRNLWTQCAKDRRAIKEIVEFASGDQLATAPMMPNETTEHWAQKPRVAPNFLGVGLDKLASLYTSSPVRTLTNASTWRSILWGHLDATLAQQDRAALLTGTLACVLLPEFAGELQPNDTAREPTALRPRYFTPDRFVAIPDPSEPTRPAAVSIHWRTVKAADGHETEILYYWDETTFAILRGWDDITFIAQHGFGVCPVAMLRNTDECGLYGRAIGGRDLIQNARAITGYMREVVHTARLQRGQPYSKGPIENPVLGPDVLLEVDEAGDFAFANNGADLPGMLDTLERMLAAFALTLGLPRGTFQLTGSLDLAGDHTELARFRQRRAKIASQWEREIHRIAAAQWKRYHGRDLRTDGLHTAYVEEPPPMSVAERQALAAFGLEHGLRDEYATARALWPHLSDAEIKTMVDDGLAAQARRAAQQATIAGHARDVDGGMPTPDNGTENREDNDGSSGTDEPPTDASGAEQRTQTNPDS